MKKTSKTIVGARPPGGNADHGRRPGGIEVLISKASLDSDFKKTLLTDPIQAARDIGLNLKESERMILQSTPPEHLGAIIRKTKVEPEYRSAFFGKAAALMLAAVSAMTVQSCDCGGADRGFGPDGTLTRKEAKKILRERHDSLTTELSALSEMEHPVDSSGIETEEKQKEIRRQIEKVEQELREVNTITMGRKYRHKRSIRDHLTFGLSSYRPDPNDRED